jgi:hypothetical protein
MGSVVTKKLFIVHIVNNLTLEYDVVIVLNHSRIDVATDMLMIDSLRELLTLIMVDQESGGKKGKGNGTTEDTALSAGGKFKGKCRPCGKYGHKIGDCWAKDLNKPTSGG